MALKERADIGIRVLMPLVLECQKCDKRLRVLSMGPPYSLDRCWSFEPSGYALDFIDFTQWALPTTTAEKPFNPVCLCGDCRPKEA